ncbi:ABC-type transport auxiliary lipoprotein family protein [Halomonas sp. BLK-85]
MARRLDLFMVMLLLAPLLTACASSVTPAARYLLPSVPAAGIPATPVVDIQVDVPQLAHFLDVDGIVLQLDDIEMREARDHQWGDTLDRQLARNLRSALALSLPATRITRASNPSREVLTLSLDIDEFQGRYDGYAVASGQWQLRNADNQLLHLGSFTQSAALVDDGYPALVRALGQAWNDVADEIAQTLQNKGYAR